MYNTIYNDDMIPGSSSTSSSPRFTTSGDLEFCLDWAADRVLPRSLHLATHPGLEITLFDVSEPERSRFLYLCLKG